MSDNLPASIRRQAEEAAQLEAGLQPTTQDPATTDPPAPVEPVAPAAAPTTQPPAPPTPQPDPWEHKYRTLQGILDTHQRTSREAQQALQAKLDDALSQIEVLRGRLDKPVEPAKSAVSAEEVEAFGTETIELMRKVSWEIAEAVRAESAGEIAELKATVASLREQTSSVKQNQDEVIEAQFWKSFAALVPDYEAINAQQPFLDWLAAVDDVSGVVRQALLNDALSKADAKRAAALFHRWVKESGWTAAPAAPAPAADQGDSLASELEAQVAPGGTRSGVDPVGESPLTRIWTAAEIGEFYTDVTRGKYSPTEATRIQSEIDLALQQGRIRDK